ncbi:MAG: hypothetical protein K2J27_04400 [Duncaniella sp.]|nr:hypothetical protein [Duncaniella sp.]
MKLHSFILFASLSLSVFAQETTGSQHLWQRFSNPTSDTRTKVWWFHGETESTKKGMDADLREFSDKGVGGVVWYDQVHSSGSGAVGSMTPEWWENVKYAAGRAAAEGLSFEVALSNGYVAGGPWITPELAMKRTVWVDTLIIVDKEKALDITLPKPHRHFRDIATLIFPYRPENSPITFADATVSLRDGASAEAVIDLGKPMTIRGITYDVNPRGKGSTGSMNIPGDPQERYFGAKYIDLPPIGTLQWSDDSLNWHTAAALLPVESVIGHKSRLRSISFPPCCGRWWRITYQDWMADEGLHNKLDVKNVRLHLRDIIDNAEVQTGLRTEVTYPHPIGGSLCAVIPETIRNVTHLLDCDTLSMTLPASSWRIIRMGYQPTGSRTKHGRKNALGLEADVMSAQAAKVHFDNYFKVIHDSLASIGYPPAGVTADSHEAGIQNWTEGFEKRFERDNGYDITPWLPAFAGYIVGDRETTDKVLRDFRRSVASTIASEFYGTIASLADSLGVTFTSQAMLNIDNDNIVSRGRAHKPQGEFWAYQTDGNYDCLDAASAAHLYGHPIASAEAFTDTPYSETWDELRRIANLAYCRGINEFVVCASSHQPWPDRKYDDSATQHPYVYHRYHPDWNNSRDFWDYQARCTSMLREGEPVVDLCVYIGEDPPLKTFAYRLPAMPEGYNFDVCTLDALLNRMSASSDSLLNVDGGMTYRALVVQDRTFLSPRSLAKIDSLAEAGVPVVRCDRGEDVGATLSRYGLKPDLAFRSAARPDDCLRYFHRKSSTHDIYFVYNHSPRPYSSAVRPAPTVNGTTEIWNPLKLTREKAPLTPSGEIALSLQPYESCFIVIPHD